jgi:hypothetical protein
VRRAYPCRRATARRKCCPRKWLPEPRGGP